MDDTYIDVLERIALELQRIADMQYVVAQDLYSPLCPYEEFPDKRCTRAAGHRGLHNVEWKQETMKLFVRTWYDRSSRNWISQVVDEKGNQVGDSLYDGTKKDAEASHRFLRSQVRDGKIKPDE